MTKEIMLHGQRVTLYSSDQGHTWTSSPQATVRSAPIEIMKRLELQKQLDRIDSRQQRNFDDSAESDIRTSFNRR